MEKKVVRPHIKGQKHIGKTDWNKLSSTAAEIDNENPELAFKKKFTKPSKS